MSPLSTVGPNILLQASFLRKLREEIGKGVGNVEAQLSQNPKSGKSFLFQDRGPFVLLCNQMLLFLEISKSRRVDYIQ